MCINRLRSRIELKHILVCKWRTRGKHHADIWLIQMNYRILWYLNVCETWRTPCSVVFNHKKYIWHDLVPDWRTWLHRSIDLKIEIFLIRLTGIFWSRPISYLSINISWKFQVSSYSRLLSTARCIWLTEWTKSFFQHGGMTGRRAVSAWRHRWYRKFASDFPLPLCYKIKSLKNRSSLENEPISTIFVLFRY